MRNIFKLQYIGCVKEFFFGQLNSVDGTKINPFLKHKRAKKAKNKEMYRA